MMLRIVVINSCLILSGSNCKERSKPLTTSNPKRAIHTNTALKAPLNVKFVPNPILKKNKQKGASITLPVRKKKVRFASGHRTKYVPFKKSTYRRYRYKRHA